MNLRRLYDTDAFDFNRRAPSFWEASAGKTKHSASSFNNKDIYDVAIIGGGFTGQSAALTLAKEGNLSVVVLEAGSVGWGASGRNGGFCCMGGSKLAYQTLIRKFGLTDTQKYFRAQIEAIDYVKTLSETEGIEFDAIGSGEMVLAHKPSMVKEFREEQQLLQSKFGINAKLLNREELEAIGMSASGLYTGLHMPQGFGLHPLKYTYGLFDSCIRAGINWFEHCAVEQWQKQGNEHQLITAKGQIRARRIIVATNGYTAENLQPDLAGKLLPVMSNIMVTRPLTNEELQAQGWNNHIMSSDSRNLLHYFRLLPDNRFLFGGRGGINASNSSMEPMRAQLVKEFYDMFPAWSTVDIDYFWRGFAALSYQLTPHISAFKYDASVFYAMAYHGNGVAMGSWSGHQVARLLLGKNHDIPQFMQKPLSTFPLPFLRKFYLHSAYLGYHIADNIL